MSCDNLTIAIDRPVVFLDLCGVIADIYTTRHRVDNRLWCPSQVKISAKHKGDRIHLPTWQQLNALFEHYDVQIVMVSSWVRYYLPANDPDIIALGKFLGTDRIIGSLYTGGGFGRGKAVKACVKSHCLKRWLVIDDARHRMYADRRFFNNRRFVHPHGRYGIGAKDLEKIDYLLGGQSKGDDFLERLFKIEGLEKW